MVVFVVCAAGGCVFDGDPGDGVVLCADDDDCVAGFTCDTGSHLCVGPGAPALVDVAFSAAVTNAEIIALTVRADVPLSTTEPVLIELQGGAALGFAVQETAGTEETLVASLAGAAPGLYTLRAVTLPSVDGVRARVVVEGPSFVLDRTAPTLFDTSVSGSVVADVDGFDAWEVCATANEPVDVAASVVNVGAVVGSCAADSDVAGRVCCGVRLASGGAGESDGVVVPVLVVKDLAGNAAEQALAALVVDASAPDVVEDSVAVDVRIGARDVDVVSRNASAVVSFVVDEDLGEDPVVVIDGVGLVVSVDGRAVSARVADAGAISAGAHDVEASVVDVYGHRQSVVLALPAPHTAGLVFANDDPACPAPAGVFSCFDLDGDLASAPSGGCPDGDDFDDRDAALSPVTFDFPLDDVDQDGDGNDTGIAGWFHVDSEAGADTGGGGRGGPTAPFRSLNAAIPACDVAQCQGLLLAERATAYALGRTFAGVGAVSGGRDPTTWAATGARSQVTSGALTVSNVILDHLQITGGLGVSNCIVVDSVASSLGCEDARVLRSSVGVLGSIGSGTCIAVDSDVDFADAANFSSFSFLRSRVAGAHLDQASSLSAVSSLFTNAAGTAPIQGEEFAPFDRVSLIGCTVVADASASAAMTGNDGIEILLVGSVIVSSSSGPLLNVSPRSFAAVDSTLFSPRAVIKREGANAVDVAMDFDELVACGEAGCDDGNGVFRVVRVDHDDPDVAADGTLGADSVARAALDDVFFDFAGLPSSVLVDLDGRCRYDGATATRGAITR